MKVLKMARSARDYFGALALLAITFSPFLVQAGDLDSPAAPIDAGSAMFILDDIYNRLETGAAGAKRPGSFREPSAVPGATGHTLNELMAITPAADNTSGASPADVFMGKTFWGLRTDGSWGLHTGAAYPAPAVESGQTTSYASRDNGALRSGITPPTPRFTDNNNGTVTDNLTGLIWLKNANCFNMQTWDNALNNANALAIGQCNLTDGSTAGQWRLPQVHELESMLDYGRHAPTLPAGHPFTDVQSCNDYWSSTTIANDTISAWSVDLCNGVVGSSYKHGSHYVWPVRGGQ